MTTVAKRWRGFLVHVALARTYPVFYRLTQMHVRQPPRHPLLDRQLPSLLHVKALALLDEALDEALTKASVMPSTFGLRADLNGRIDTARRAGLLAPATAKRLHEARTRRNELAHEFDAMVDWDTMDADLIGIHASLVELGLSGPMPKLDVAWSRTPNTERAAVQYMRVYHRRRNIPVTQELLHGPDVRTALQQVRRERVPQRVARRPLGDAAPPHGDRHRTLHRRFVQMMTLPPTGAWIRVLALRWKDPLPLQ